MSHEADRSADLRGAFAKLSPSLTAVAVFSAVVNLLMLTGPLFMLQVYDRVLGSRSSSTLLVLFVIVIYLYVLMGVLDYVRGRILDRIGARLQSDLDRRVLDASLRQAEDPSNAANGAAGLRDLGQVQALFASPALGSIFDLPWTPVSILVLFVFHPLMGWFGIACAVLVLILAIANQRMTRRLQAEAAQAGAEADFRSAVMRSEIETVRGLGMAEALTRQWEVARGTALQSGMRASTIGGGVMATTKSLRLLLQSAMLALGAWLVLQDQLTAGAIMASSILLGRTLAPLEQTVSQWPLIQRATAARASLGKLLAAYPAIRTPMDLPLPEARLSVSGVSVIPPGQAAPTLRRISFDAEPGDVIAVVGPSGSGKSTLARVLTGHWPPSHGQIRLGGATLDQIERDRLGLMMGYLPQRAVLFSGTVAQNIARFQPDASPEAIVAAATSASAHELILTLTQGYDTRLSDGGNELSGGQRQRIGLARAFFGNPLVLVLDEPNSALDEPGVKALNRAIAAAKAAGRIVFIMSHRPSALAEANKVMMIEAGEIRAFGPRDDVLSRVVRNPSNVVAAVQRNAG